MHLPNLFEKQINGTVIRWQFNESIHIGYTCYWVRIHNVAVAKVMNICTEHYQSSLFRSMKNSKELNNKKLFHHFQYFL